MRGIIYLLVLVFTGTVFLSYTTEALARRGGGFSRSFSRPSFRGGFRQRSRPTKSWGSRNPGGYQRKGGIFGSGKSTRGKGFNSQGSLRGSGRGRKRTLPPSASTTRSQRSSSYRRQFSQPRTVINQRYYGPGGWNGFGWGMGSVGIWDLFFLSTVTNMFWYHHWQDPAIQKALYQDNLLQKEELARLEGRVAELEQQGVKRDPDYLPEGVDPDVALSKDYVAKNSNRIYQKDQPTPAERTHSGEQESGGGVWLLTILLIAGISYYGFFVRKY